MLSWELYQVHKIANHVKHDKLNNVNSLKCDGDVKTVYFGPANFPIIFAITGATLGFAWCFARLAGFFITAKSAAKKSKPMFNSRKIWRNMQGKENREEKYEGMKKWKKIKNRFKFNKLFLCVTSKSFHLC